MKTKTKGELSKNKRRSKLKKNKRKRRSKQNRPHTSLLCDGAFFKTLKQNDTKEFTAVIREWTNNNYAVDILGSFLVSRNAITIKRIILLYKEIFRDYTFHEICVGKVFNPSKYSAEL